MPPPSVRFRFLASAVFAISTFGATEAREGPGFDCAKAHQPLAQFICADDGLSLIDLRLNQAYRAYRYTLTPEAKNNLDKDEVAFIRNVIIICRIPEKMEGGQLTAGTDDLPKQRDCIAESYTGRTEILKMWSQKAGVAVDTAAMSPPKPTLPQAPLTADRLATVEIPTVASVPAPPSTDDMPLPIAGNAQELDIGHLETPDDTGINWLNFHCNQNDSTLACDVFQTLIMHKVEPGDREKEIAKQLAGDVQNEFKVTFAEACKNMDKLLPMVTKAAETGVGQDGRKLNPRQAQEGKLYFESLAEACRNTSLTTIRHFVEIGIDKDIHTCRVTDSYSHMNFSYDTSTQQWISKEGPKGPCGSVSVATLAKDKVSNFWLFNERVMYTNPGGSLPGGVSCSKFPDRTMNYTWRAADNFVECIHLENSM